MKEKLKAVLAIVIMLILIVIFTAFDNLSLILEEREQ